MDTQEKPSPLLVPAMLLIAVMASLDLTIVSVALRYMQGSLDATSTDITWVLTMYAVSQAVSVALTGHLAKLIGRRRLALIAVSSFAILSALCGMSQTLDQIVFLRFLQGFAGGPLIPLSQAVLVDRFPPEKRVQILSIWTMGVMGGPVLGPFIGGFLSQHYSWTWNFFVNVPVGLVAFFLCRRVLKPTERRHESTDFPGLIYLCLFVLSLQVMIDQGDLLDWFSSKVIVALAIGTVVFGVAFVLRSIAMGSQAIVPLYLFKDRNFAACCALIFGSGCIYLGVLVIIPELALDVYGWESTTAGSVLFVAGLAGFCSATISGRVARFVDIRVVVAFFVVLVSVGWFQVSRLNINASPWELTRAVMFIQVGIFFLLPRLAAQAFATIPTDERNAGSGLYNFTKTIGFAVGTAAVSTFIYRRGQFDWHRVGSLINEKNPDWERYVQQAEKAGLDGNTLYAYLGAVLEQRSELLSILQLGLTLSFATILLSALIFFLKEPGKQG